MKEGDLNLIYIFIIFKLKIIKNTDTWCLDFLNKILLVDTHVHNNNMMNNLIMWILKCINIVLYNFKMLFKVILKLVQKKSKKIRRFQEKLRKSIKSNSKI